MSTSQLQQSSRQSNLLNLPPEIKALIWHYAFADRHIHVWSDTQDHVDGDYTYPNDTDSIGCEACDEKLPPATYGTDVACNNHDQSTRVTAKELARRPERQYQADFSQILICKDIFPETTNIFQSTLTLHIRSPEVIAYIRRSAPRSLRQRVSKVVLYVHFHEHDHNHFHWCMRLFELREALPALKCLNIEYHMRPPVSYDNLQDAVYFYIPLLALPAPFSPPRYVTIATERTAASRFEVRGPGGGTVPVAATDGQPGLTFHTQYMRRELLFQAHFLGDITTDDAIEEHTYVVRDLFMDPAFLAATHRVLEANRAMISASVAASYAPRGYPKHLLELGFESSTFLPPLQHALLAIARRHERPWFERLQKRRIVDLYMKHGKMTKLEAEGLLNRQLAKMPEGEGLQEWMQRIMLRGDGDGGDVIAAAMLGVDIGGDGEGWPENWEETMQEVVEDDLTGPAS